jgi:hypothetical protein
MSWFIRKTPRPPRFRVSTYILRSGLFTFRMSKPLPVSWIAIEKSRPFPVITISMKPDAPL